MAYLTFYYNRAFNVLINLFQLTRVREMFDSLNCIFQTKDFAD